MATPRLGLVVEDKPTELSCVATLNEVLYPVQTKGVFSLCNSFVTTLLKEHFK